MFLAEGEFFRHVKSSPGKFYRPRASLPLCHVFRDTHAQDCKQSPIYPAFLELQSVFRFVPWKNGHEPGVGIYRIRGYGVGACAARRFEDLTNASGPYKRARRLSHCSFPRLAKAARSKSLRLKRPWVLGAGCWVNSWIASGSPCTFPFQIPIETLSPD